MIKRFRIPVTLLLFAVGTLVTANEQRYVQNNVLISELEPTLAISVDDSFEFLGKHAIRIRDVAAGERFVYVDASGDRVNRLFIVQFEGFLPGIDDEYRYNLSQSPIVAGYPFRSNGYAFDLHRSVSANPTSESADTKRFLEASDLKAPKQWMMWRSLTVTDEAKRNEMIIFYVEDPAGLALSVSDLYQGGSSTDLWRELQRTLEKRANRSFELTVLDESGAPDFSGWTRIPLSTN